VIADNCSTDSTQDIARQYAAIDPRIRLHVGDRFLPIIANWNRALRQMPADAAYCKVLHADDRLFPECLERMAGLMARHPTVGLVSSYVLCNTQVEGNGLPPDREVWDGAEICRNTLLNRYYLFGSPSTVMVRGDLIRGAEAAGFYNEDNVHADLEVCYQILRTHDFGFVHQVLSFTRRHPDSVGNTHSRFYNPQLVEYLGMMRRYGPHFLPPDEFERVHAQMLRDYRRTMARRLLAGRGRRYWDFHRSKLERLGYRFGFADVARGAVEELARLVVRPAEALRLAGSAMPGRQPRPPAAQAPQRR
jgi:glycosyltransferase involved in cell wall biosynthesis